MPIGDYSDQSSKPGLAGQIFEGLPAECVSRISGNPTAQVSTMTIDAAQNSTLYTLEVEQNGVVASCSFTSDATATTTEIADGLEAALLNVPSMVGMVSSSQAGAVITLTSQTPGVAFTAALTGASAGDGTFATTTANALRADLYPGRVVVSVPAQANRGRRPLNTDATAQIDSWVVASLQVNESLNLVLSGDFNQDGVIEEHIFPAPPGASNNDAVAGLVIEVNVRLDAAYGAGLSLVAAASTAGTLTLTAEIRGVPFSSSVSITAADGAAATGTATLTRTANVPLRPLGVAGSALGHEPDSSGFARWPGGQPVEIIRKGVLMVELDANATPALGDKVLYRAVAGASESLGAFRTAIDSTDCRHLPNAEWHIPGAFTVGGRRLGVLRLY